MGRRAHHGLPGSGRLPEGVGTEDLFGLIEDRLSDLRGCLEGRRNRDRAGRALTDLWLCLEMVGRRVGRADSFEAAGRGVGAEEEDGPDWERWDDLDGDPMLQGAMELEEGDGSGWADGEDEGGMNGGGGSLSLGDLLQGGATADEEDAARERGISVRQLRLEWYRNWMIYMAHGARSESEVARRVVALIRPAAPELLMALVGARSPKEVSQAAVARRFGETRAAVQAREKKWFERPQVAAGVHGYKGLGGARSEGHREACKQAQLGNQNRRQGTRRRKGLDPLLETMPGDGPGEEE